MSESIRSLYYVTNRRHVGEDRWRPDGYGTRMSDDGQDNLRFGRLSVSVGSRARKDINRALSDNRNVDGKVLVDRFEKLVRKKAEIEAYPEAIDPELPERMQANLVLGSKAMFADLHREMSGCERDVVVFIHGYAVSWEAACASALAFQESFSAYEGEHAEREPPLVVLFTWPSNGSKLPYTAYRSDRTDARGSGSAIARAFLKLRDFLLQITTHDHGELEPCGRDIHLICHSMGNFVLQHALVAPEHEISRLGRKLFDHVFLVAADVDDDVLEPGGGLDGLTRIASSIGVYHNADDRALVASNKTKGNPERLGQHGASRPDLVHRKVYHVDCKGTATDFGRHSYFTGGLANLDIRDTIVGVPFEDRAYRARHATHHRSWRLNPAG